MRVTRDIASIVVKAVCLLSLAAGIANLARAADGPPAAPVVVAEAGVKSIAPSSWVFGSVVSRQQAEVSAEVTGRLLRVVEVGDVVEQGQTLAVLDASSIELQLEELRAQIDSEQARLTFLVSEVGRLQTLASTNNAAKTQLEQTQADRDATRGALAAARSRLRQAQDRIERSVIKAPFAATVAQRLMEKGEWAESGDAIVELININNLEVQARVPLGSMPYLKTGARLMVKAGDAEVNAVLRSLVPIGDSVSRLADMRLDFINPGWAPGQSVRVAVPTGPAKEALVVPRDALVLRSDSTRVFRVGADNKAEPVDVTLGGADGAWIEVNGALAAGDRVIVRGAERILPGQAVRINGAVIH